MIFSVMWLGFFSIVRSSNIHGTSVWQLTDSIGHTEEPHWDSRKNILYFTNTPAGEIHAYHYQNKSLTKITLNGVVTPVVPSRKDPNLLIIGQNRSVVAIKWDGINKLEGRAILTTVSHQFPKNTFNDGKADKQGRLWWGTTAPIKTVGSSDNIIVSPNEAALYKITRSNINNPTIVRAPVTLSNGLTWNKANNKFYYIDSTTLKVLEFDYNDTNGTISSTSRTVFDVNEHKTYLSGLPDGMTIDSEDNLYIALFQGGCVVKVNPKSRLILDVIAIPARDVTSVAFGGPQLDILFVTTSKDFLTAKEKRQSPAAGSVFEVKNLNVKGLPAFTADIIDELPKKEDCEELLQELK